MDVEMQFREAVMRAVKTGLYKPFFPQASFVKIFNKFRANLSPGLINKKITSEEYDKWTGVYIDVLQKINAEIKICSFTQSFIKKRQSIVTPTMMAGAKGREKHHQGVLKHNK